MEVASASSHAGVGGGGGGPPPVERRPHSEDNGHPPPPSLSSSSPPPPSSALTAPQAVVVNLPTSSAPLTLSSPFTALSPFVATAPYPLELSQPPSSPSAYLPPLSPPLHSLRALVSHVSVLRCELLEIFERWSQLPMVDASKLQPQAPSPLLKKLHEKQAALDQAMQAMTALQRQVGLERLERGRKARRGKTIMGYEGSVGSVHGGGEGEEEEGEEEERLQAEEEEQQRRFLASSSAALPRSPSSPPSLEWSNAVVALRVRRLHHRTREARKELHKALQQSFPALHSQLAAPPPPPPLPTSPAPSALDLVLSSALRQCEALHGGGRHPTWKGLEVQRVLSADGQRVTGLVVSLPSPSARLRRPPRGGAEGRHCPARRRRRLRPGMGRGAAVGLRSLAPLGVRPRAGAADRRLHAGPTATELLCLLPLRLLRLPAVVAAAGAAARHVALPFAVLLSLCRLSPAAVLRRRRRRPRPSRGPHSDGAQPPRRVLRGVAEGSAPPRLPPAAPALRTAPHSLPLHLRPSQPPPPPLSSRPPPPPPPPPPLPLCLRRSRRRQCLITPLSRCRAAKPSSGDDRTALPFRSCSILPHATPHTLLTCPKSHRRSPLWRWGPTAGQRGDGPRHCSRCGPSRMQSDELYHPTSDDGEFESIVKMKS